MTESKIAITGYVPGVVGRLIELHGTYYATYWGLGLYFEARVAAELAAFMQRFNPQTDGLWVATANGQVIGGIVIDGNDAAGKGARLRWFIIDPAYQGQGVGNRLVSEAVEFCKRQKFKRVYLTTFAGLNSARHLYEKQGFRLHHEEDATELTGKSSLVEQVFELVLDQDDDKAFRSKNASSVISI
ncbi:MAG TPA: GNAT family N-acetyltransferase [Phototrophicaceae bacterium]|jgi:GNAT superfamily N-acetyltransferase|nr:GNAT family N-acetyltransferase [Phototrophicaceae bacterium]